MSEYPKRLYLRGLNVTVASAEEEAKYAASVTPAPVTVTPEEDVEAPTQEPEEEPDDALDEAPEDEPHRPAAVPVKPKPKPHKVPVKPPAHKGQKKR